MNEEARQKYLIQSANGILFWGGEVQRAEVCKLILKKPLKKMKIISFTESVCLFQIGQGAMLGDGEYMLG